jgi:1-acyl-sn-glycerol-3-phosphate acyltransferase
MEKYKRFTDAATGINPFVPHGTSPSLLKQVVAAALAMLVIPVVAVCYLGYVLFGVFPYQFLGGVVSPLHGILSKLFSRIACAFIAWAKINVVAYPPRPSTLSTTKTKSDEIDVPSPGDIIFANCQSPLDPLALQCAFPWRPLTFVFPHVTASGANDTEAITQCNSVIAAAQTMMTLTEPALTFEPDVGAAPSVLRCFDFTHLQQRAKRQGRVVVVFAEGTTTNGKGVLRLPAVACDANATLFTAAIAYSNMSHPSPLFEKTPFIVWLIRACMASSIFNVSAVDVAVTRPSHRPPLPITFSPEWSSSLQAKLCQAISFNYPTDRPCKPVASTAFDKQRFLCQWEYYHEMKRGVEGQVLSTAATQKDGAQTKRSSAVPMRR